MNGKEWMEALKNKTVEELNRINNALIALSEDEDIKREYSGTGLFDGFPSLIHLVNDAIEDNQEAKPTGYLIIWKIDSDAETPEKAAMEALKIQRDKGSEATVFEVIHKRTGKTVIVDAVEEDFEPAHEPDCECGQCTGEDKAIEAMEKGIVECERNYGDQ